MALGGGVEEGVERLTGGERCIGGAGGVEKREDDEDGAGGGVGGGADASIFLRASGEGPMSSSQVSSSIV
jgi:hypothetical protein